MEKVRIAIAGCGSVSEKYLPNLKASSYAEVVSVCDAVPARAQQKAEQFGVPAFFASVEEMLDAVPSDMLLNLTGMQEHYRINKLALESGRHVYCEKPLATSIEEAKELLALARGRGLNLWGAPNAVTSPQFACMAQVLASGEIGKVHAARALYGHGGPSWGPWFYKRGGGSLLDLGVYNVTTLTGLLGPAKQVTALCGVALPERFVDGELVRVEADDNVALLIDHGDAVYSCVQTGFVYGAFRDDRTIELIGIEGAVNMLGYDWAPRGVEVFSHGSGRWDIRCTDPAGYTWSAGASYVAECLVTGKKPLMTAEHAIHVLEIMLAALESAATGRRIAVHSTFPWPLVV